MSTFSAYRRAASVAAGAALAGAGLVVTALPASATSVSGVRVTKVTASSFTVSLKSLGKGWKYRLYASRTKSDVYYANLKKAPYQSALSTTPVVAVSRLPYGNGTYFWRVQAVKSTASHTSDQYSEGLVPPAPTNLAVTSRAGAGTWLTWSSHTVSGFQVQQIDAAGHSRVYSTSGQGHQFTPLGLTRGATYSFRVRAMNVRTASPWTPLQQAVAAADQQPVRVATFNLLTADSDGSTENGQTIDSWTGARGDAAAAAVLAVRPDVLGVQEGAAWIGSPCTSDQVGTRQVDDLLSRIRAAQPSDADYRLSATEIRPCLHQNGQAWFRTGDYIVYDNARYAAVGTAGAFDVGRIPSSGAALSRYAAYQVLRNRTSGAQFLFVSPHLYIGNGSQADQLRLSETQSMISQARAYAQSQGGLPIVYAGDMNSTEQHSPDGPEVAALGAGLADARMVAASLTNDRYNSANGYLRKPPADGHSIDHVFVEPGVGVARWALYLHLSSSGTFVGAIPSDHNLLYADLSVPF